MTAADERDPAAGAWPADRIRRYVWLGAGVLIAAVLLTAFLHPAARWLKRRGCPRSLAAALLLTGSLAFLVGMVTLTVNALITGGR